MQHILCLPSYLILPAKPWEWYCHLIEREALKKLVFYLDTCVVGDGPHIQIQVCLACDEKHLA